MHGSTWLQAVAELDAKITELEFRLSELRQKRNSLIPINQLPSEILARILFWNQSGVGHKGAPGLHIWQELEHKPMEDTWTNSMLVCRRFRETALASHTLWAYIDLNRKDERWHELCLTRSKQCPLTLYGFVNNETAPLVGLHLEQMLPRALHVRLSLQANYTGSLAEWRKNMPVMRALSTHQPFLTSLVIASGFYRGDRIPTDPISDDATPFFPSLKELYIEKANADLICTYPFDLLSHVPNLTTLTLENLFSNKYDDQPPVFEGSVEDALAKEPLVHLPHLTDLFVRGSLSAIVETLLILPEPKYKLKAAIQVHTIEYEADRIIEYPNGCAPLLQYMHARVERYLRKANTQGSEFRYYVGVRQVWSNSDSFKVYEASVWPCWSARSEYMGMEVQAILLGLDTTALFQIMKFMSTLEVKCRAPGLFRFAPLLWTKHGHNIPTTLSIHELSIPATYLETKRKPREFRTPTASEADDPWVVFETIMLQRVKVGLPALKKLTLTYEDYVFTSDEDSSDEASVNDSDKASVNDSDKASVNDSDKASVNNSGDDSPVTASTHDSDGDTSQSAAADTPRSGVQHRRHVLKAKWISMGWIEDLQFIWAQDAVVDY